VILARRDVVTMVEEQINSPGGGDRQRVGSPDLLNCEMHPAQTAEDQSQWRAGCILRHKHNLCGVAMFAKLLRSRYVNRRCKLHQSSSRYEQPVRWSPCLMAANGQPAKFRSWPKMERSDHLQSGYHILNQQSAPLGLLAANCRIWAF